MIRQTLIALFLLTTNAYAQSQPATTPDATHRALLTLPNVADVTSPGLSAAFDASKSDKEGKVAIVLSNKSESLTFGVTATGAIDKESSEAKPLDLEGLASDASVQFSVNVFQWPGRPDPSALRNFCLKKANKTECDDTDFSGQDKADFLALGYADRNPWMLSFSAEVGRSEFGFKSLQDLESHKEQHNDWIVGFEIGQYHPTRGFVAAGYDYKREWEAAGTKRRICTPLVGSVPQATECIESVIGSPDRSESSAANIQWRKFFKGGHVAINPKLIRDFSNERTALSLPLYFFKDSDGGLAGGIRTVWRSDLKSPTVAIFVGTALAIID